MAVALFYFFGLVALIAGILVVILRNPLHGALSLFGMFFSIAGIFVLLNAPFVAAVQLIVYAGGILVLYVFVIMFMGLSSEELRQRRFHRNIAVPVVLAGLLAAGLGFIVYPRLLLGQSGQLAPTVSEALGGNPSTFGHVLFRQYAVPFELLSLVLLVGMIGVVILGKPSNKRRREDSAHD